MRSISIFTIIGIALMVLSSACGSSGSTVLTIYAGRSQTLVQPLLEQFAKDTGVKIRVKYGDGTDLALGILEEGKNTPADVYMTQDVGALGALVNENRLAPLPQSTLDKVPVAYRSKDGLWVGLSGRARVIVYNTDKLSPAVLPTSVLDYTNDQWRGRLGFVPRSDGFPEFVTALRLTKGEDFALNWLKQLKAINARPYANNIAAIQAVANGEIDVAFLNHYYLYRFLAEQGDGFKARNYFFTNGDIGGIFLVSGVGVLNTSKHKDDAQKFVDYLLSPTAQKYFASSTFEYPLVSGVEADPALPPLSQIKAIDIDLSDLTDLKGSLELMRQAGLLP